MSRKKAGFWAALFEHFGFVWFVSCWRYQLKNTREAARAAFLVSWHLGYPLLPSKPLASGLCVILSLSNPPTDRPTDRPKKKKFPLKNFARCPYGAGATFQNQNLKFHQTYIGQFSNFFGTKFFQFSKSKPIQPKPFYPGPTRLTSCPKIISVISFYWYLKNKTAAAHPRDTLSLKIQFYIF